ncbi:MAG: acyl-ACP thioesterase domain-containing protein [Bacteroidota bacterium]
MSKVKLNKIGHYAYSIQPFEVDVHGNAFVHVLGNNLLHTAGRHADERGFGLNFMLKQKKAWVLSRMNIQLKELPKAYENFTIKTWIHNIETIFSQRNFEVLSDNGALLATATTSWAAIDLVSRRPIPINSFIEEDYIPKEGIVDLSTPTKIQVANTPSFVKNHEVVYTDLDLNKHVYSIRYLEWMMNLFDLEYWNNKQLQQITINYLAEILYKDQLELRFVEVSSDVVQVVIFNKTRDKVAALGEFVWE